MHHQTDCSQFYSTKCSFPQNSLDTPIPDIFPKRCWNSQSRDKFRKRGIAPLGVVPYPCTTQEWIPWEAHARFVFLTKNVTRKNTNQFTCQTAAKTATLHSFFHSENHILTYVNVFQWGLQLQAIIFNWYPKQKYEFNARFLLDFFFEV